MTLHYRNETLFSEIYLEEITRQPEEDHILASLRVLREYRDYADVSSLAAWTQSYIHEVFAALGFNHKPKRGDLTLLFPMGGSGQPVSLCCVTLPDESLDNTMLGSNWAEKVIRALREEGLQWGLLTNGKSWRIYHVDEATPYETYLEIDLERILAEQAKDAYQIFHKFMKAENFLVDEAGKCQFDRFKKESKDKIDYIEKELANALKQREENGKGVLSDLCMGYVDELRQLGGYDLDDEVLRRKIYHGSMLYMFRLLFLFYADARGLLSDENHDLLDSVEADARAQHKGERDGGASYAIWERLAAIFVDIDQTYNGGLFSPQESEFTQFIEETRIADQYLAGTLFNLTTYREKNGEEHPISYRDMSVRHLGTLYEGLLEHKLFITQEETEVRVTKNKIEFIPVSRGGKLVQGRFLPAGAVYFAGDLSERKSSGSYFTPENVVNYIVNNTVGDKLRELKNIFLKNEKATFAAMQNSVSAEERSNLSHLIEESAYNFVREHVLTLSVLDPAMGSGHFLVNVTNLIANFVTEFLNELGIEGEISTDPAYWRRWVVENCIYGVDLNPLAVELAKLSLWILSMAKDQPLSFVNHHLKCGNSLVGARLENVGVYPYSDNSGDVRQLSYFDQDREFNYAVQNAVQKSKLISEKGSLSLDDVDEKKSWYEEIEHDLRIYKSISNAHTDLFFNSSLDEEDYISLVTKKDPSKVLAFENIGDFFHWELEFPNILINRKGFDCIVGNPPYVDVLSDNYFDLNYESSQGRNLYNYFVEQGLRLLKHKDGKLGFIIPISIITSDRMKSTRAVIRGYRGYSKFLNIDSSAHPGTLFDGLNLRLSIVFTCLDDTEKRMRIYSSDFTKFFNAERETFISRIRISEVPQDVIIDTIIPKVGTDIGVSILRKMLKIKKNYFSYKTSDGSNKLYYKGTGYNYMLAFKEAPFFEVNGIQVPNSKTKELILSDDILLEGAILVISSSLFYWFWTVYSNCFDFTNKDFGRFPIDLSELSQYKAEFQKLYKAITADLQKNADLVSYNKASGVTRYYQYRARLTKPLFDKVDDILARIYGFSEEELDYIKNYDVRFRTDDRE